MLRLTLRRERAPGQVQGDPNFIYINPFYLVSVEPEREGAYIQTPRSGYSIEETSEQVLNALEEFRVN